ncbi:MAG: amidohydrolase family protein [Actinobacteria bacterium]|nr:amidohydrolase family protein [Actinomycetota bacterium]
MILAPDWTPACSDDLYRETRRMADEFSTGITTHALETRSEMSFNFEHYGMCGLERLQKLGVLGEDTSLAHFVWATDRDIDLLVETGSGTDGISFGDRDDFFDEIRLAALLQRRPMELESGRISSSKLFRSAFTSGARAVRAEEQLGSLEVGKDADLLVLRREDVFWPPQRYAASDPLDVIIDRADQSDLETVMVRGRTLMQGGEMVTIDEKKVREGYADAAANRLWEFVDEDERRQSLDLPAELEPFVLDFYGRWTDMPTDPGYSYNTTTGPERR